MRMCMCICMKEFVYFAAAMIIAAVFNIKLMKSVNREKEARVYCLLALLIAAMGFLYFLDPRQESLAENMMDIFKVKL